MRIVSKQSADGGTHSVPAHMIDKFMVLRQAHAKDTQIVHVDCSEVALCHWLQLADQECDHVICLEIVTVRASFIATFAVPACC